MRLDDGWNQIQFNLSDFTRRAYGTNYVETLRVQIHANCRIRRIYFSDRLYTEDELPAEFRLLMPIAKKNRELAAHAERNALRKQVGTETAKSESKGALCDRSGDGNHNDGGVGREEKTTSTTCTATVAATSATSTDSKTEEEGQNGFTTAEEGQRTGKESDVGSDVPGDDVEVPRTADTTVAAEPATAG